MAVLVELQQHPHFELIERLVAMGQQEFNEVFDPSELIEDLDNDIGEANEIDDFKNAVQALRDNLDGKSLKASLVGQEGNTSITEGAQDILDAFKPPSFFDYNKMDARVPPLSPSPLVDLNVSDELQSDELQSDVQPSISPVQREPTREERLAKLQSSRYMDATLKAKLTEMSGIAGGPDSPRQRKAKEFLDRTLELTDNMEELQKNIDNQYESNIKEWDTKPMTTLEQFRRSKFNNKEHKFATERCIESQTMTYEALMQGANKIISSDNDQCAGLVLDDVILPYVTEKKKPSRERQLRDRMLTDAIFKQQNGTPRSLDEMITKRKACGYKRGNKDLYKHGRKIKREIIEENKRYAQSNKDCFTTEMIRNTYLEALNYKAMQERAWKEANPGKTGSASEYSKMRLSDMKSITLEQIQFKNLGGGVYSPNMKGEVEFNDGQGKRRPKKKDLVKGMVQLLMLLQAEGKTHFKCESNNPAAIEAFRVALAACNIPPEQATIYQKSKNRLGKKSGRSDKVSSKMSLSTRMRLTRDTRKMISRANESHSKVQQRSLYKQQQIVDQRRLAQESEHQVEQNQERGQSMDL